MLEIHSLAVICEFSRAAACACQGTFTLDECEDLQARVMPIWLEILSVISCASTCTRSHDASNTWSPLEHAHRAAWHANTAIDNALAVTCPSLSSAMLAPLRAP